MAPGHAIVARQSESSGAGAGHHPKAERQHNFVSAFFPGYLMNLLAAPGWRGFSGELEGGNARAEQQ